MPLTLLFTAALGVLALLSPLVLLATLVAAAVPRSRRVGLRMLLWELAGGAAGVLLVVLLNLAWSHGRRLYTAEGLAFGCGAGLTAGAAAGAIRTFRRRSRSSFVA
jgi:hypothetical protein